MPVLNASVPGGAANAMSLNLQKLMLSNFRKPKVIFAQWPPVARYTVFGNGCRATITAQMAEIKVFKFMLRKNELFEINGLESSGKSLLGAHILAETQKKDGIAVYIDTETSVSQEFMEVIGLDLNKMLYLHLETVEEIFEAIEEIVTKVRESDKDRCVTILVDSLAAASTFTLNLR